MSLRPVTLLFVMLSAFWLTVAAPLQAAAETFLVVINAGNRISASDAELREVVRQLYLKEESRWPDDLPSTPIARPVENASEGWHSRIDDRTNSPGVGSDRYITRPVA